MIKLLLIRHGPTSWNETGRVQGHSDIPLSDSGRARVRTWRLPEEFADFRAHASPLARARETATILGFRDVTLDARLKEMHWGEWEGETLDALRVRYGEEMIRNESRGLDFRAPAAESPRDVQRRMLSWCAERAAEHQSSVAVAHKGVLRVVLAAATGWDMTGPAPVEMEWDCAHLFELDRIGRPTIGRLNIALVPRAGAP
ncbi:MAG: histidine phosphatase family protein [Alphaproteobacteria bacterium]